MPKNIVKIKRQRTTRQKGAFMLNKSLNPILGRGVIILLMLTFLCINILVAQVSPPEAPIKIEISVSKDKIYVGDSIDVYATITLLKDHPNYVEGKKYRIQEITTYPMVNINGKWMPLQMEKPPLWEIQYSDKDKILDENNSQVNFHFRQRLNRMPDRKNLYIEIMLAGFPLSNILDIFTKRVEIECLEDGLEYKSVIFPENRKYRGEGHMPSDHSLPILEVKTGYHPSQVNDVKEINPELFKIEAEKVENKRKPYPFKFEGRTVFKVLVNTTLEHDFGEPISNVSCDPQIGTASGNGSILIFNAASTIGATGNIYYTKGGQNWYMQIELIEDYDINGSFKFEKDEYNIYYAAIGEVRLYNLDDPDNPILIDSHEITGGGINGNCAYSFSDIYFVYVAVILLLKNDQCLFSESNVAGDGFVPKGRGFGMPHIEFYNYNTEDINLTWTLDETDDDGWNWYWWNMDMCGALNVFEQEIRAENFSSGYLSNQPRDSLCIYSHIGHDYPVTGYPNNTSWFLRDGVLVNGEPWDIIFICGYSVGATQHLDQWDNSVILHELGHAYHWDFAEYTQSSHSGQPHGFSQTIDDTLAWYEGFANFFPCLIKSETDDIVDQGEDWEIINVATWGTSTVDAEEPCDDNGIQPTGNACEGAVCATLWDIYDNVETGNPNWNDDEICYGYDEIWIIMVSYQIEEHYCYTFNDFLNGWDNTYSGFTLDFIDNYLAHDIIYTPSCSIEPSSQITQRSKLINSYPNPFSPGKTGTKIFYNLSYKTENPQIEIYNIRGQKVKILQLSHEPGTGEVVWNGTNDAGDNVSSGIYFQKLVNNNKVTDFKKMLLIK